MAWQGLCIPYGKKYGAWQSGRGVFCGHKWIMIGIIYFHNPVYLGGKYIFIIL